MKIHTITAAIQEAERFINRARAVGTTMQTEPGAPRAPMSIPRGRTAAALRRASLDLSAALATMRRRSAKTAKR